VIGNCFPKNPKREDQPPPLKVIKGPVRVDDRAQGSSRLKTSRRDPEEFSVVAFGRHRGSDDRALDALEIVLPNRRLAGVAGRE